MQKQKFAEELNNVCARFEENLRLSMKELRRKEEKYHHGAAVLCTMNDMVFSGESFEAVAKRLDEVGEKWADANGRKWKGVNRVERIPLECGMLVTAAPETFAETALTYSERYSKARWNSEPMLLSGMLSACCVKEDTDGRIEKCAQLMEALGKKHGFLTRDEDYPLAYMMCLRDVPLETMLSDEADCYRMITEGFRCSLRELNAMQSVSQALASSEMSSEESTEKLMTLFHMLGSKGYFLPFGFELIPLAVLVRCSASAEILCDFIIEADRLLLPAPLFSGILSADRSERLLCAVLAVLITAVRVPYDDATVFDGNEVGMYTFITDYLRAKHARKKLD